MNEQQRTEFDTLAALVEWFVADMSSYRDWLATLPCSAPGAGGPPPVTLPRAG